jgi:hypothetical protein
MVNRQRATDFRQPQASHSFIPKCISTSQFVWFRDYLKRAHDCVFGKAGLFVLVHIYTCGPPLPDPLLRGGGEGENNCWGWLPRVARASQPWARIFRPFRTSEMARCAGEWAFGWPSAKPGLGGFNSLAGCVSLPSRPRRRRRGIS